MSDPTGLLRAMRLDANGGATPVSWPEIRAWTPGGDRVLWVHLDRTSDQATRWLRDESGVDEVVAEAMLSSSTRPRCTEIDDGLLLIMRGVNLNPGADPEDLVSLRMWAEPGRVITFRRERLMAVEDVARDLDKGKGPRDVGSLIARFAHRLAERMESVVDEIGDSLDVLEDHIVDPNFTQECRGDLVVVRRQVISLRRFLGPQRIALTQLSELDNPLFDEKTREQIGETANRIARYVEDLDAARERAMVLQEETMSQLGERLNARIYVLTVVASIVLPLTLVAGILGMNVGGIPLASSEWGLVIVTAVLVALGVVFAVILRRLKWL